ncbi:MAG: SMC-Scp complex subunit ScpB [Thermoleophilia bacterium]|nr:SMC-Scp complex subunit ScpB [Thermoleophilia bacterium]
MSDLARTIDALLFISPEPLEVTTIQDITAGSPAEIDRALAEIRERHHEETGLELAEIAGGWALRTRADLAPACDRLRARPREDRLSPAALETLSVVAYLEPVTRREIGRLRGVDVDSTLSSLIDHGLIEEADRTPSGGAMRYQTTTRFLERFGLARRGDLPPLERFELTGPEASALRARLHKDDLIAEAETGDR